MLQIVRPNNMVFYQTQIMGVSWVCCSLFLHLAFFVTPFPILVTARPTDHLTVNYPTSWTNKKPTGDFVKFNAGIILATRSLFGRESDYTTCGCGFFCNQTCDSSLFAILSFSFFTLSPISAQVVWSANPKNPVRYNATLKLTSERGLVLQDADGTIVWSTNISTKSVAGLHLTDTCNLMLLDEKNATIWQSFDHPTDTLVLGQKLVPGQQLTSRGGLFSLSLTTQGLFANINSNPPQSYFFYDPGTDNISYVQFQNRSLAFFDESPEPFSKLETAFMSSPSQYMRFEPDGHLRVYSEDWKQGYDVLTQYINGGDCGYPTICGNYSICSNGQCICPPPINGTSYFRQIDGRLPNLGCSLVTPLSCEASKNQILLELQKITYFPFSKYPPNINPDYRDITSGNCTQACLKNCSCKAAIYDSNFNVRNCYLQVQIFSLKSVVEETDAYYKVKVFIKVQNIPPRQPQLGIILGSSLGSLLVMFLLIGIITFLFWKKENADEAEENYLDHVPGMPIRYSYHDLQVMTGNFIKELGGGGFGTVFEGTLIDGTMVAVKRLDGQIKKSFLTEVQTIGCTHHFNLVRLIGYCAEKFHRLLVYEYMSNGSLDKWIFYKNSEMMLDWKHRKKIITDIARGLTYLHEECRQKIVHLDIKPHNILLDENFNAKISDFGLSRLVDHDQSQVVTTMRGTPGYMAPEWLSSVITEKVDVYSFGIVLLEILCGRRNLDRSQPEEAMYLLDLFKKNITEHQLLDLVDKNSEDMQLHREEVVNMMRVAAWCLQNDFTKRPSMSMVVRAFEGAENVESDLDYFFSNPPFLNTRAGVDNQEVHVATATLVLPSVLSGPR